MPEAVGAGVRVTRMAGEASRQIEGLNRSSQTTTQSIRQLENEVRRLRADDIQKELTRVAGELRDREREVDRAMGRMDPQLRTRMLAADPARQPLVQYQRTLTEAFTPAKAAFPRAVDVQVPRGLAGVPPARAEVDQAIEEESRAVRSGEENYRRLAEQKRASVLTDRELQRAWTDNTKNLRDQQRELEQVEKRLEGIQKWNDLGMTSKRERVLMGELPGRAADLRAGLDQFQLEREALLQRAGQLGMGVGPQGGLGPKTTPGGGGLFGGGGGQQIAGAFLLGAAGGGPLGGLAAAAVMGNPTLAVVEGIRFGWTIANSAAETYEQTQRRIFDAGLRLGGGFSALRSGAQARLEGPLKLRYDESLGAMIDYGQQTGRTDVDNIMAFARAYGLPVEDTASLFGQMGRYGYLPRADIQRRTFAISARMGSPASGARYGGASGSSDQPASGGTGLWNLLTGNAPLTSQYATLNPRSSVDLYETREIRRGRDIADIVASAYQGSAYSTLPSDRQHLMMQAFLEQNARLVQRQATGGAPISDFERMPRMLSAATRLFGPDLNPQFAGNLVEGLTLGIQQPPNDVARGIALRSLVQLGQNMSPEERAEFQKATMKNVPGVGIDLTSYSGAMAAMQNATALPPAQAEPVIRAILQGYRGVVGQGTESARMFFTQMFGGRAALGITAEAKAEDILSAPPGSEASVNLVGEFQKMREEAGTEAAPFLLDAQKEGLKTAFGEPLKELAQSIEKDVLDVADIFRSAKADWENSGTGMMSVAR